MKQSWRLRFIFVFLCISIMLYLGYKRNLVASISEDESWKYQLVINEVMVNNRSSIRDDEGDFEDWIEIYNKGDVAINLHNFGLSNDPKQQFVWRFPDRIIQPKSFSTIWISGKNKNESDGAMHTNFKLKNKDKVIILTSPNNKWKDIVALEPMGDNISYGRVPDGSTKLYGFDGGTPGKANTNEILIEGSNTKRLEGPLFSHNGGFYTQAFNLNLTTNDTNATIYYTLDGSVPTKESNYYNNKSIPIPFNDSGATIVRARTYQYGYPNSEIITQSYFVKNDIYDTYNIPVISLVTDPKNLFDYEKGIYVPGKIFDQWKIKNPSSEINSLTPANYNQKGKKWEREASIELFESNGTLGLIQNIGIRIHGGYSRTGDSKSLSLFARKDYDDKEYFMYDFFDGKSKNLVNGNKINQFYRILLRNSATDRKYSLFRDALIQSLVQDHVNLDIQNSKPSIVYINGEYYGIHNIREAYNKDYISNRYNINQEDVVMIKNPTGIAGVEVEEGYVGDEMHYNRIINYLEKNDLKIKSNYDYIKTQMDLDNFIEYNVLQIYCDNRDWPGNNVRIWRKRTQGYNPNTHYGHDGRWRWMVFDLDYGFGLYTGEKAAKNNSLKRATEMNGPDWPNPPWSTILFRSLLENAEFKNQFINVFADQLNTIFLPEVVIDKVEAMEAIYFPNIMSHITRWNLHHKKVENWSDEIKGMKNFAIERPKHIYQHITEYFGLSGTATIRVISAGGGSVKMNSLRIENTDIPWEGVYFKDIPITAEAIAEPGFVFVGWEGISTSQDKMITINLSQSGDLKAVFERNQNN